MAVSQGRTSQPRRSLLQPAAEMGPQQGNPSASAQLTLQFMAYTGAWDSYV